MIKIRAKNSCFFEDKKQKTKKTIKRSNFRFKIRLPLNLSKGIASALKLHLEPIKSL